LEAKWLVYVRHSSPPGTVRRPSWRTLFELEPIRPMEWKRWHDGLLVEMYRRFVEAFHATNDGRTPLGEQRCWPNCKTHVLFALGEIADIGG